MTPYMMVLILVIILIAGNIFSLCIAKNRSDKIFLVCILVLIIYILVTILSY